MNRLTGLDECLLHEDDACIFVCQNKSVVVQPAKLTRNRPARRGVGGGAGGAGAVSLDGRPPGPQLSPPPHPAIPVVVAVPPRPRSEPPRRPSAAAPADPQCLVLHEDGSTTLEAQLDLLAPTSSKIEKEIPTYGIIGLLDLDFVRYIVHVTKARFVGTLGPVAGDGKAWQVVKAGVVPVYRKHYVTLSEVEYEKESVKAVLAVASSGQLYFSYDYDLTRTVQKNSSLDWAHPLANLARRLAPDPEHTETSGKASEGRSKHQAVVEDDADERFLWNRSLLDPLIRKLRGALPDFCVGCIFGHVSSTVVRTRELRSCTVSLIMRVNRRRAGTRFIKRGIDSQGNAACGVQTEMSAHNGESICAHVQARGSPPVMWDQIPTGFMASPPIRIHHTRRRSSFNPSSVSEINLGPVRRHVEHLLAVYGPKITFLNLLDPSSPKEGPVAKAMGEAIEKLNNPNVKHLSQPLTRNSGSLRGVVKSAMLNVREQDYFLAVREGQRSAERLAEIVSVRRRAAGKEGNGMELFMWAPQHKRNSDDWFVDAQFGGTWRILQRQSGVLRTNCLDCIDRTNIVQFRVGCEVLTTLMMQVGAFFGPPPPSPIFYKIAPARRCRAGCSPQDVFDDRRNHPVLDTPSFAAFRAMWADAGNAIARLQTGTLTVGTLFVRRGGGAKTTSQWLQDYRTRFSRYYMNYFADPYRQMAVDVFLGQSRLPIPSENSKYRQLIRKRTALADAAQPWYIFFFLLAKRLFAPHHVDTVPAFLIAIAWLLVTKTYIWLTRVDPDTIFRQHNAGFELLVPGAKILKPARRAPGPEHRGYSSSISSPRERTKSLDLAVAYDSDTGRDARRSSCRRALRHVVFASENEASTPTGGEGSETESSADRSCEGCASGGAGEDGRRKDDGEDGDITPIELATLAQVAAKQVVVQDLRSKFDDLPAAAPSPVAALTRTRALAGGGEDGVAGRQSLALEDVPGNGPPGGSRGGRRHSSRTNNPSPPLPSPQPNWPLTPPANFSFGGREGGWTPEVSKFPCPLPPPSVEDGDEQAGKRPGG